MKGVVNGWNQMGDAVYRDKEGNMLFPAKTT